MEMEMMPLVKEKNCRHGEMCTDSGDPEDVPGYAKSCFSDPCCEPLTERHVEDIPIQETSVQFGIC